ncbi:MAG: transglutaminase family protein [Gammaproteobacteria bacterium]|nr:transglutaminase family protein [Gammaproteobacteria bacterium]
MKYRVQHITTYSYPSLVSQCHNVAHLLPRDTPTQRCHSSRLQVKPRPTVSTNREDYFGNPTRHFTIEHPHRSLVVTATSVVDTLPTADNLNLDIGNSCADVQRLLQEDTSEPTLLAREFAVNSPLIARADWLAQYAAPTFTPERPFLGAVREFVRRIFTEFTYESGFTTVTTALEHVMKHKKGVCQDFAHLAIGCLRSLGYPARYVSGYIETLPPPGQEKLVGSDASHAWFSVYSPGEGWYDFDPTNDLIVGEQHIAVGWGRDFSDVTPLKGVIFGNTSQQNLSVSVDVRRLEN